MWTLRRRGVKAPNAFQLAANRRQAMVFGQDLQGIIYNIIIYIYLNIDIW